jgi:hypothetical protein
MRTEQINENIYLQYLSAKLDEWLLETAVMTAEAKFDLFALEFLKANFNPNQPRVPAGNPDGGQWSDNYILMDTAPDAESHKRATAIYGETSGLFPQLTHSKNPYNPKNWDKNSAHKLEKARIYVGIISERNPKVHFVLPNNLNNDIISRAWSDSIKAAIKAKNTKLHPNIDHFFLRQDGVGVQAPWWGKKLKKYHSIGPFNNFGGGDVPKGSKTYIDFYGE